MADERCAGNGRFFSQAEDPPWAQHPTWNFGGWGGMMCCNALPIWAFFFRRHRLPNPRTSLLTNGLNPVHIVPYMYVNHTVPTNMGLYLFPCETQCACTMCMRTSLWTRASSETIIWPLIRWAVYRPHTGLIRSLHEAPPRAQKAPK